jgi:hypothetical protein
VITEPAGWTIHSQSAADAVEADANTTDTSGDGQYEGFKFGGFGGPDTLTGTFQTFLLSPSELSGSTQTLHAVSFCYFVGSYPPGNTDTNTVIDHIWVYELTESSGATTSAPSGTPTTLLDESISSIKNKTGNCKTVDLSSASPAIADDSWLLLRVEATDKQSVATTSGALVQLGRVTANYSAS